MNLKYSSHIIIKGISSSIKYYKYYKFDLPSGVRGSLLYGIFFSWDFNFIIDDRITNHPLGIKIKI